MAAEEGSAGPEEDAAAPSIDAETTLQKKPSSHGQETDEDDESEDEEEEEPRLKYATLTKTVSSLYRNGDASSCFLVAGDKMVPSIALFVLTSQPKTDPTR